MCCYVLLEAAVKPPQRKEERGDRSRMWMTYAAGAIDLTSDGLMIGSGAAVSSTFALILAGGRSAFGTYPVNVLVLQVRRWLRDGVLLPAPRCARRNEMAGLVFVAGLLTVAAVEDMLEEAHAAHDDSPRSVLAFIGGFALFTPVSAGLGELAGR